MCIRDRSKAEEAAEADFLRAIEIAQAQKAKSLELQAAISLYKLHLKQGRGKKSQAALAKLYNWFTEGFDTADLREAKTLLATPPDLSGNAARGEYEVCAIDLRRCSEADLELTSQDLCNNSKC